MQNKHFRWGQLWVKSPMETCVCFMSKRQEPVLEQLIFHSVGLVYFWESAYHHLQEECSLLFSLVPSTPVHSHGCVRTCPRTAFPAPWIPQHNRVHRSHLQATCSPNVEHGMKQPPAKAHQNTACGGQVGILTCTVRWEDWRMVRVETYLRLCSWWQSQDPNSDLLFLELGSLNSKENQLMRL